MFRSLSKIKLKPIKIASIVGVTHQTFNRKIEGPGKKVEVKRVGLERFYEERFRLEEKNKQEGITPSKLFQEAKVALERGDTKSAIEYYKKMEFFSPIQDEIPLYQKAAEFLFENNEIHSAVTLWKSIMDPSQIPDLWIRAGNKLLEEGRIEEAVGMWGGVDEKELPALLAKAGDAYYKKFKEPKKNIFDRGDKERERAIYFWKLAEQKGHQSASLFTQLAYNYLFCGDMLEAETYLLKALALNPGNARLYNELGVIVCMNSISGNYLNKESLLNARDYFIKAKEIEPNDKIIGNHLEFVTNLITQKETVSLFSQPYLHLKPVLEQLTCMFDALLVDLQRQLDYMMNWPKDNDRERLMTKAEKDYYEARYGDIRRARTKEAYAWTIEEIRTLQMRVNKINLPKEPENPEQESTETPKLKI